MANNYRLDDLKDMPISTDISLILNINLILLDFSNFCSNIQLSS